MGNKTPGQESGNLGSGTVPHRTPSCSVRPGPCGLDLCQVASGWLSFLWRTTSRTQGPLEQMGKLRLGHRRESVVLSTWDPMARAAPPSTPHSPGRVSPPGRVSSPGASPVPSLGAPSSVLGDPHSHLSLKEPSRGWGSAPTLCVTLADAQPLSHLTGQRGTKRQPWNPLGPRNQQPYPATPYSCQAKFQGHGLRGGGRGRIPAPRRPLSGERALGRGAGGWGHRPPLLYKPPPRLGTRWEPLLCSSGAAKGFSGFFLPA